LLGGPVRIVALQYFQHEGVDLSILRLFLQYGANWHATLALALEVQLYRYPANAPDTARFIHSDMYWPASACSSLQRGPDSIVILVKVPIVHLLGVIYARSDGDLPGEQEFIDKAAAEHIKVICCFQGHKESSEGVVKVPALGKEHLDKGFADFQPPQDGNPYKAGDELRVTMRPFLSGDGEHGADRNALEVMLSLCLAFRDESMVRRNLSADQP
jgi:hypothetical protein